MKVTAWLTQVFGWLMIGMMLGCAVMAQAPKPQAPVLELKVEDGRGARVVLRPLIQSGVIPTDGHGTMLFEYNPDKKTGWIRINRPEKESLIGRIVFEDFIEHGNQGILLLTFKGEYFTGFASFTLYPFRYNYANPSQHTGGIMLTSGAVRIIFHPEEP